MEKAIALHRIKINSISFNSACWDGKKRPLGNTACNTASQQESRVRKTCRRCAKAPWPSKWMDGGRGLCGAYRSRGSGVYRRHGGKHGSRWASRPWDSWEFISSSTNRKQRGHTRDTGGFWNLSDICPPARLHRLVPFETVTISEPSIQMSEDYGEDSIQTATQINDKIQTCSYKCISIDIPEWRQYLYLNKYKNKYVKLGTRKFKFNLQVRIISPELWWIQEWQPYTLIVHRFLSQ